MKTAGSVALASVLPGTGSFGGLQHPRTSAERPRICVLTSDVFPAGEVKLSSGSIEALSSHFEVVRLDPAHLREALSSDCSLFVNLHGSFFPKVACQEISDYLRKGGHWLNVGGVPLSLPTVQHEAGWRAEAPQTGYHKEMGITQSFVVEGSRITGYVVNEDSETFPQLPRKLNVSDVFELYVRLTGTKDFPEEDGSAGQRDAVIKAVMFGTNAEGQKVAAPIVCIDRLKGDFAGGRWVFVAYRGEMDKETLAALVRIGLRRPVEFRVRPSFACYDEGELPTFTVELQDPSPQLEVDGERMTAVELHNATGEGLHSWRVPMTGHANLFVGRTTARTLEGVRLTRGLYTVGAVLKLKRPDVDDAYEVKHTSGFWVYDEQLLSRGNVLTADRDYIRTAGAAYPVCGTTYMSSDVHRKFLLDPNPALWNRDFRAMKSAGINMVRTGIWTGWKNYMLDVGSMNEAALRALDAFILTARSYDIPVLFTFFAFLPESWGGVNPYLDPRSVQAQRTFVTAFAQRYRSVPGVMWDLVNEPSFCSSRHLWSCRPNYDAVESAEWIRWLQGRYACRSRDELASRLSELYRQPPTNALTLPALEEFQDVSVFDTRRPLKVVDYRLFAQEMFARWVRELSAPLRALSAGRQLVTVGQDEGGTFESPSPHFFAREVDFTCIHNWWLNDDLFWDYAVTKTPERASLVEETGAMFYERMNGTPWRTEHEVRNLIERKLVLSIAAGSAGVIDWIWNTNPYMMSDNEVAIGLLRADETEKPEMESVRRVAAFVHSYGQHFDGRQSEDVLLVIPHSLMFSTRNAATEATRKSVRAMVTQCGRTMVSASEYALDQVSSTPRLVLVPCPRVVSDDGWRGLKRLASAGSTVLITGPVDADEHWLPAERLSELNLTATTKPIAQEEILRIGSATVSLGFRGVNMERLEKGVVGEGTTTEVTVRRWGKGKLVWSPLPVELADGLEPTVVLYRFALQEAESDGAFAFLKPYAGVAVVASVFRDAALYGFVSEAGDDSEVSIRDLRSGTEIHEKIPSQRARLLLVGRRRGEILGRME